MPSAESGVVDLMARAMMQIVQAIMLICIKIYNNKNEVIRC